MDNKPITSGTEQGQLGNGGHYTNVNGLKMYYHVYGPERPMGQPPLVLLHGALSATGTSFGPLLPGLEANRQLVSIEQQAHGHTADIDRPLTVEQMAEDTLALLRQIGVHEADFFGYSMGSAIALHIAIHTPEIVDKLVLMGGVTYKMDGLHPGMAEGMDSLKPEDLAGSPFHEEYLRIAPKPEDFPQLIEKVKDMDRNTKDISSEAVRSIQAPTLLIIGDADIVRPEHVVEMFRLLGGGVIGDLVGLPKSWLAILPGTTHITVVERSGWVVSMIQEFLDRERETGKS